MLKMMKAMFSVQNTMMTSWSGSPLSSMGGRQLQSSHEQKLHLTSSGIVAQPASPARSPSCSQQRSTVRAAVTGTDQADRCYTHVSGRVDAIALVPDVDI